MSDKLDACADLFLPPLDEVADVWREALVKQFAEVNVEITACPNLKTAPFHLAATGFGGNAKLVDVGGVKNLVPTVNRQKIYDVAVVAKTCNIPSAFVIGAGAGPFQSLGTNCEMMTNVFLGCTPPAVRTHLAWIDKKTGAFISQEYSKTTEFALMGNFLMTDGQPANQVIKVVAKSRKGANDFITTLRLALKEHYGNQSIGIGGVFVIKYGEANLHIMPDFSDQPLNSDREVNEWLKFYPMKAPLVCLSVFYSHDPGLDLRIDHTHCFSQHGQGGHYHYDLTPETVEYEGYFVLAEKIYRVDKP